MLSLLQLDDINGKPIVKIDLPRLKIGDPVALRFKIERHNNGRTEELRVDSKFRIVAVGYDFSEVVGKQLLSAESIGRIPVWISIKTVKQVIKLKPAKFPRTVI